MAQYEEIQATPQEPPAHLDLLEPQARVVPAGDTLPRGLFTSVASSGNSEFETSHMSLKTKLERSTCTPGSSRSVPLPPGQVPKPLAWPPGALGLSSARLCSPTPSPSHAHTPLMLHPRRKTHLPLQTLLPPARPFILYPHAYLSSGACQLCWEAFSIPPPNPRPRKPFQAGAPSALGPLDDTIRDRLSLSPPAWRLARARPVPDSSVCQSLMPFQCLRNE